jgi:diguanylate cyclase (GGDEF)-like protein
VGILLADLDSFKAINDTHGHLAGDDVLREVGTRLSASVRDYDAVGRYGGEEFLIVMPGCDASATRDRAESFRRAVGSLPVESANGKISVTLSLGAVSSLEWGKADTDVLLHAADAALYRAKAAGRNWVELAAPDEMRSTARGSEQDPATLKPVGR